MKKQLYLENQKLSSLVFIACFFVYTASYIGKLNFSTVLPEIVGTGIFTKSEAGIIGSSFFVVYGFFQIVNGFLADKISPFKMIITGTFLSSISNILMTMQTTNTAMALVWAFNGFSLSLLWSAVLKISSTVINTELRAKACLNLSATLPVGSISIYILSAILIKYFNWKSVFLASSLILLIAVIFFTAVYFSAKPHFTKVEIATVKSSQKNSETNKLFPVLLASGAFMIIPAVIFHGTIKEGITTWVPTMITELYNTESSFSVFISIILPIVNLSGIYITNPIYKKMMKENEVKTVIFILSLILIPLILLLFIKNLPLILSVLLLSLVTTALNIFNHMTISLVPVAFSKYGKTGTVSGIMNASAYLGCAFASYGFGIIADLKGWIGIIVIWLLLDALAIISSLLTVRKWSKFKNECL